MKPRFFATPARWRAWLSANHHREDELWVGFYKRATGRPSITWPQSVDEALCFGWIDGIRRSVDAESYAIRFTPRRSGSTWSVINLKRVKELMAGGLMGPAGLEAYQARRPERTRRHSFEQRRSARLPPAYQRRFQAEPEGWTFFQAQPPWYRRTATWWVVSAKKEETRVRRLDTLIKDSVRGRRIGPLARKQSSPAKTD